MELKLEEIKNLNIYEKIQYISQEIKNIEKNMTVGTGTYSYKAVSDLDVTLRVKEVENKYRLISIPIKQEITHSEVFKTIKKDGLEAITHCDNIKMTVRLVNIDNVNEFIDVESFGKGIDPGDKGFGKASTYARKYALMNAYKIATGEDPDANKSEETLKEPTISQERIAVLKYLDANVDSYQKVLKNFNAPSFDELSDEQIKTIYKTYKQRKLI